MGLAELLSTQGDPSTAGAADEPALGAGAPAPAKPAPEGEDEGLGVEEGGKVPVKVVGEYRAKHRAEKEARVKAEAALKDAEAKYAERLKRFEARYGKFEKPDDQMEEDATVAEILWELRETPEAKAVLALIQKRHQGVRMTERTEKAAEAAAPKPDPRVDQLVQERIRDAAGQVLRDGKVRKELHKPIIDYVLSQNPNPTREAVFAVMNEYAVANEWSKEFIREPAPSKRAPTPLGNPGGFGGGVPPKAGEKPAAAAAPEKPKSLSAYEAQSRQMMHEKLAARGIER